MPDKPKTTFQPSSGVAALKPYAVPRLGTPIDLYLDGNEGQPPETLEMLRSLDDGELLRRYPSAKKLEALLAERTGVSPNQLIVTAGADDAIYRACTTALAPGRTLLLPSPTFPMLAQYATLIGADIEIIPWMTPTYPTDEVLGRINDTVTAICIVSPNNPTGAVATADDVRRVAETAPHAMIMLDCAYEEFADEPLTEVGLEYDNVVVFRTLSKAWGLAGLRVGYAISTPEMITLLRTAGNPYPVSNLSLEVTQRLLEERPSGSDNYLNQIRKERDDLTALLKSLGANPIPSGANFVLAKFNDAKWVWQGLISQGISARRFPGHPMLDDYLRITLPGKQEEYDYLGRALRTVLSPDVILFDMDGVIADVSRSYRRAIVEAAKIFGVEVTSDDIERVKRAGDANNDWDVTHALVRDAGQDVSFDDVKARFEELYHGTESSSGLWQSETLITNKSVLEDIKSKFRLGIVTGRPRRDAERFLKQHDLTDIFDSVVCMEDAAIKPDPAPVLLAMKQLDARTAWLLGDTPDDICAARSANVLPIGIAAQDSAMADALINAGTGRVLQSANDLPEILP